MTSGDVCKLALVGTPNSGKTSLFNALTGSRQKVGNYPGATVERRFGRFSTSTGLLVDVVDLPGSYSLRGRSPDEVITRDVVLGAYASEPPPDVILSVVDATNLKNNLRLVLELKAQGRPMLLILNMMDLAQRRGIEIDCDRLASELGIPVVPTVAVRKAGLQALLDKLSDDLPSIISKSGQVNDSVGAEPSAMSDLRSVHSEARRIATLAIRRAGVAHQVTEQLDRVFLHPVEGICILL